MRKIIANNPSNGFRSFGNGIFQLCRIQRHRKQQFPVLSTWLFNDRRLDYHFSEKKYNKLYMSEAIGSFALYTLMVSLFTSPVVDALKTLIN